MTDSIGARSSAWRRRKNLPLDPSLILNKATEELGEVARAFIGHVEGRPDRGDVVQEAAQTIIVLASFIHEHSGGVWDVMEEVEMELRRLGA